VLGSIPGCQCDSSFDTFGGMIVGVIDDSSLIVRCRRRRDNGSLTGGWRYSATNGEDGGTEDCGGVGNDEGKASIGFDDRMGSDNASPGTAPSCDGGTSSFGLSLELANMTSAAIRRAKRSFACRTATGTSAGSGAIQS
jgi:hypothetical protein